MRRVLACLLTLLASGAAAQENIYVGLGFGEFDYEEQFVDQVLGQVSDSASTYKVFGGFGFNDYFAIEISYAKVEDIEQSGTMDNLSCGTGPCGVVNSQLGIEYTTTSLAAVGQLPLESVAFLGGLGYFSSSADFVQNYQTECCGSFADGGEINDNGMMAMVGIEWRFGRFGSRYAFRLEYEWWDMADVDTSAVGLGFSYGF